MPRHPYLYPPVARSNLLAQLQWAEAHDEAAREIASRGASFIAHEMDEHHRWCAMHAAVGAVGQPAARQGRQHKYRVISYLRRIFFGLICPLKHTKEINLT